ncbi:hypothetical protein GGX14DRAFT_388350 [Mycena pura]|uniref:Uncharacterized protein n=1 Tax=Mycena pura TaxID=153505 RepID=A0AAD6YL92_9AGAR|nr:hypothetical protein GGX14DRAFT_388350 [Mycena pura]
MRSTRRPGHREEQQQRKRAHEHQCQSLPAVLLRTVVGGFFSGNRPRVQFWGNFSPEFANGLRWAQNRLERLKTARDAYPVPQKRKKCGQRVTRRRRLQKQCLRHLHALLGAQAGWKGIIIIKLSSSLCDSAANKYFAWLDMFASKQSFRLVLPRAELSRAQLEVARSKKEIVLMESIYFWVSLDTKCPESLNVSAQFLPSQSTQLISSAPFPFSIELPRAELGSAQLAAALLQTGTESGHHRVSATLVAVREVRGGRKHRHSSIRAVLGPSGKGTYPDMAPAPPAADVLLRSFHAGFRRLQRPFFQKASVAVHCPMGH